MKSAISEKIGLALSPVPTPLDLAETYNFAIIEALKSEIRRQFFPAGNSVQPRGRMGGTIRQRE
jgi:hypothetical protein